MNLKRMLATVVAFSLITLPNLSAKAEVTLNVGDYVQMGTYNGEAIIWRCIAEDSNGMLMLSDKIISAKAFDAKPVAASSTGSHAIMSARANDGSNFYPDSNLACWLNSAEEKVTYTCGNEPIGCVMEYGYPRFMISCMQNGYENEKGFLTNFTELEMKAIKETTQTVNVETSEKTSGGTGYVPAKSVPNTINAIIKDNYGSTDSYKNAAKASFTSKMFIPSLEQMYQVEKSIDIDDFVATTATDGAIAQFNRDRNADYEREYTQAYDSCAYWLRDAHVIKSYEYGTQSYYINKDGKVTFGDVCKGTVGVRPAFYFDADSDVTFASGDGTYATPYSIGQPIVPAPKLTVTATTVCNHIVINVASDMEITKDCLHACLYDDDGAMVDYMIMPNIRAFTETNFVFMNTGNATKAKVFLWESLASIHPIVEATTVDILPEVVE